jgi:hypothetical protein
MKIMQWPALKILTILLTVFLLPSPQASSQVSSYRLQQADSLFNAKQYTQSLDHYKQILKNDQYTSSMLLKMAFIEEGLSKTGDALYYLNLYFIATQDESVLNKMDELARKDNLSGYENTGSTQAYMFYQKYHFHIAVGMAAFIFLLFSISVFMKRKRHNMLATIIPMFVFLIAFAVHLYAGRPATNGIVVRQNTYLMSGPSAGADLEEIIEAGHRVVIKGNADAWVEVEWNGKSAYIRRNQLLPVVL